MIFEETDDNGTFLLSWCKLGRWRHCPPKTCFHEKTYLIDSRINLVVSYPYFTITIIISSSGISSSIVITMILIILLLLSSSSIYYYHQYTIILLLCIILCYNTLYCVTLLLYYIMLDQIRLGYLLLSLLFYSYFCFCSSTIFISPFETLLELCCISHSIS